MSRRTIKLAVASAVAVGALGVGGATMALAADSTPAPSATGSTGGGTAQQAGPQGGSQDTAVTGAEAAKVIAAVKAEDSAATITTVRKDPDGSYDALGTKAGAPVMFEVSKDLKTIEARTGGPGGGQGGPDAGGTTSGSTSPSDANGGSTTSTTSSTTGTSAAAV